MTFARACFFPMLLSLWFTTTAHAEQRIVEIDIPATSRASAIAAYGEQANAPVVFSEEMVLDGNTDEIQGAQTIEWSGDLLAEAPSQPERAEDRPATAQGAPKDTPMDRSDSDSVEGKTRPEGPRIEEITVTARKREESLQQTPVSVTALSVGELDNMRYSDIIDLTGHVPNLQIRSVAGDDTAATISMRGTVTTNPNVPFEPTVGIYLDNVFIAKAVGNLFDILDIERVEVLRGPQGTLYGKNTIGGAINIVTRKPDDELGIHAKWGLGRWDEQIGLLRINFPALGTSGEGPGKLSGKLTYRFNRRDGWADNVFISSPFAEPISSGSFRERDDRSIGLSLLWSINDQWSALYHYDKSKIRRTPPLFQITSITPNGIFDPSGALCSPVPIPGACFSFAGLDQYASSGRLTKGSNDRGIKDDNDVEGHALTVEGAGFSWGKLGEVTLRSITSRRTTESLSLLDLDGSNIDIASFWREVDYEQWSQELQILGETNTINYVIGLYYFDEEATLFNPGTFFGFFRQLGATIDPIVLDFGFDNYAAALYGQVDWRPAYSSLQQRLAISFGGRVTREEKEFHQTRYQAQNVTLPLTFVDDTYRDFSPMLAVSWDFDDFRTIYAKIAKGFKSGGYNNAATTVDAFRLGFESESLWSFEAGMKSQWLDQRLQLNGAVFHSKYDDMQVSNFVPDPSVGAASIIDNAGKATIWGIELEAVALLTRHLRLIASWGYLDGEYDEFKVFDPTLGQVVDVKNQRVLPYLADHTVNFALAYSRTLADMADLDIYVSWSFIDDQYVYAENFRSTAIDAYDVLNARISLRNIRVGPFRGFGVALWGKNLGDEKYLEHGIDFGPLGYTGNQFGEPRSYGIEFTYDF